MKKVALITITQEPGILKGKKSSLNKFINNITTCFTPNKIEVVKPEDDILLYIIRIPYSLGLRYNNTRFRLKKLFEWLKEEKFTAVAFDDILLKDYHQDIFDFTNQSEVNISYGDNILIPITVNAFKKLLKSKGLDINHIETVVISKEEKEYYNAFIIYLCSYVKYLTLLCNKSDNVAWLVDDIFDNMGFPIRICSNIKDCIEDVNLIINLTEENILPNKFSTKNKIIVYNKYYCLTANTQACILNDIIIDISSKIRLKKDISNKNKYKLCEMYILSKLDKLYLLMQQPSETNFQLIYEYFKSCGFKVSSLNGINL